MLGEEAFSPTPMVNEATRRVDTGDGEPMLAIDDLSGLISLVQSGVVEIHPWGSTIKRLEQPDRLIFDLTRRGRRWDCRHSWRRRGAPAPATRSGLKLCEDIRRQGPACRGSDCAEPRLDAPRLHLDHWGSDEQG